MNRLNWIVAAVVVVVLVAALRRPVEPPRDLWFQTTVVASRAPVLVKFGADWCPPCRAMERELDRLESRIAGRVRIVRIDVDERRDLAAHYGVSGIPRVMLFDEGRVAADRVGFQDARQLHAWLSEALR